MSDVQTGNETRLFLTLAGVEVEVAEILDLPELPAFETELYKTTHMTTGSIETHKKKPRKEGAEVTITGVFHDSRIPSTFQRCCPSRRSNAINDSLSTLALTISRSL